MISAAGGNGGIGGSLAQGGPLTPQGIVQLLRFLGGKRHTEQLGPGSFPGYDPQGNPLDTEDPYQYANFSMPSGNSSMSETIPGGGGTPGTFGGAARLPRNPWPGAGGGQQGRTVGAGGGIGSQIWKGLNSPMGQTAIGAGVGLIGTRMASNQMNRANDINQQNSQRNYEMAQEEKRRRDALIRMIMPQLMQGMQVRDPQKVQGMIGSYPGGQ